MKIGQAYYNSGEKFNYIKGLKKDDVLIAKKTTYGIYDAGASGMTFESEAFEEGKEYKVHSIVNWDGNRIAYVSDGECLHFATPEIFNIK